MLQIIENLRVFNIIIIIIIILLLISIWYIQYFKIIVCVICGFLYLYILLSWLFNKFPLSYLEQYINIILFIILILFIKYNYIVQVFSIEFEPTNNPASNIDEIHKTFFYENLYDLSFIQVLILLYILVLCIIILNPIVIIIIPIIGGTIHDSETSTMSLINYMNKLPEFCILLLILIILIICSSFMLSTLHW